MEFSLNRIKRLIKRDSVLHRKQIIIWSIALFIMCGFFMFLTGDESRNGTVADDAGEIVYGAMLILGGLTFTLLVFSEYKQHASRIQYLSLPVSNMERFISKWMYSLPLYTLLTFVIFAIGYVFYDILLQAPLDARFIPLSSLNFERLLGITWAYFILHAGALFLASLFNRFVIPKAIVLSGVIWIIGTIVVFICYRIILSHQFVGLFNMAADAHSYRVSQEWEEWINVLANNYLPWIVSLVVVPFFWVVTYFKIKEKEA